MTRKTRHTLRLVLTALAAFAVAYRFPSLVLTTRIAGKRLWLGGIGNPVYKEAL